MGWFVAGIWTTAVALGTILHVIKGNTAESLIGMVLVAITSLGIGSALEREFSK